MDDEFLAALSQLSDTDFQIVRDFVFARNPHEQSNAQMSAEAANNTSATEYLFSLVRRDLAKAKKMEHQLTTLLTDQQTQIDQLMARSRQLESESYRKDEHIVHVESMLQQAEQASTSVHKIHGMVDAALTEAKKLDHRETVVQKQAAEIDRLQILVSSLTNMIEKSSHS
eukprot:ANDGO_08226.mRNA.1 hypothetical protein